MLRRILAAMLAGWVVVGIVGCDTQKGPAERAGENVDRAVDRAGDQLNAPADNRDNNR